MHSRIPLIPLVTFSTNPKSDLIIVTNNNYLVSIHIKYNEIIHHYVFSSPQDFHNATNNY
jgi:hypothetical protein